MVCKIEFSHPALHQVVHSQNLACLVSVDINLSFIHFVRYQSTLLSFSISSSLSTLVYHFIPSQHTSHKPFHHLTVMQKVDVVHQAFCPTQTQHHTRPNYHHPKTTFFIELSNYPPALPSVAFAVARVLSFLYLHVVVALHSYCRVLPSILFVSLPFLWHCRRLVDCESYSRICHQRFC